MRLFIPLIALIVLKIVQKFEDVSKRVHHDFVSSYRLMACARADVYRRNLEDAFLYLQKRFPEMEGESFDAGDEAGEECGELGYSIYRETNEELELLYPNWVYRPALPDVDGR